MSKGFFASGHMPLRCNGFAHNPAKIGVPSSTLGLGVLIMSKRNWIVYNKPVFNEETGKWDILATEADRKTVIEVITEDTQESATLRFTKCILEAAIKGTLANRKD